MDLHNLFPHKIEVALNTEVFSDEVFFSENGSISKVSTNVKIFKNSEEVESTTFTPEDSIKLSVVSSEDYADPIFGVIQVNLSSGTQLKHIFTCVTFSNVKPVEEFKDLEPFELSTYPDGSSYVPVTDYNKLLLYKDLQGESYDAVVANLNKDLPIASNVDETDSLIICSFYDGKIYRINASTQEISGIIKTPDRPYGAIAVPKQPNLNYITDLWVTLPDEDKIIVIDNDDNIIREFPTGSRPLGICADGEFENVYVANSYDNTVTHLKWNLEDLDWEITTVSVGEKPYEIACDTNSDAWVTCAADNKVYKVTSLDTVASYIVGENPRGIAYNNGKMWVAISQEAKVVALNLDGSVAYNLENIGQVPFAVGSVPLPMMYRPKLSDLINITETLSYNSIQDSMEFLDTLSHNSVKDTLSFTDTAVKTNRLLDSLAFTETLSYELTTVEEPEIPTEITDQDYQYVVLHINGEDPDYVAPYITARYLVVEALDFHAGTGGAINELVVIDDQGNQITYTLNSDGAYDLTTNNVPTYWNGD